MPKLKTHEVYNGSMQTLMLLMAQYQAAVVPLEQIAEDIFGLCRKRALIDAAQGKLEVPVFRAKERGRGPLLVRLQDLADWIDSKAEQAKKEMV